MLGLKVCAAKPSPDYFSSNKIPRPVILDPTDPTNNVGKDDGFWELLTEEAMAWLYSPSLNTESPAPYWDVLVRGFPRWREEPPNSDLSVCLGFLCVPAATQSHAQCSLKQQRFICPLFWMPEFRRQEMGSTGLSQEVQGKFSL